jgi:hypothetical protein
MSISLYSVMRYPIRSRLDSRIGYTIHLHLCFVAIHFAITVLILIPEKVQTIAQHHLRAETFPIGQAFHNSNTADQLFGRGATVKATRLFLMLSRVRLATTIVTSALTVADQHLHIKRRENRDLELRSGEQL